jgi:hypothetical protein
MRSRGPLDQWLSRLNCSKSACRAIRSAGRLDCAFFFNDGLELLVLNAPSSALTTPKVCICDSGGFVETAGVHLHRRFRIMGWLSRSE